MTLKSAAAIAAIVLVISVLTLHRLGAGDVCTGNEAVEGVFVQQMVEHGHLMFPVENGNVPMYKPPLFHWTAVAIDRLAGIRKVTAANLRLPSALYAIAGSLLMMLFAYEILGLDAAILAGLALAASYQYISQGRFGRVDMTLCFFETLSLLAFLRWLPRDATLSGREARFESNLAALYSLAAALGCGVLAKGPVGAILPTASILIFMIVERRGRQILTMLDPGAIIIGAAIASSWYLACYFGGRFAFRRRRLRLWRGQVRLELRARVTQRLSQCIERTAEVGGGVFSHHPGHDVDRFDAAGKRRRGRGQLVRLRRQEPRLDIGQIDHRRVGARGQAAVGNLHIAQRDRAE